MGLFLCMRMPAWSCACSKLVLTLRQEWARVNACCAQSFEQNHAAQKCLVPFILFHLPRKKHRTECMDAMGEARETVLCTHTRDDGQYRDMTAGQERRPRRQEMFSCVISGELQRV
jgi:hypothetical protein